jgi:hypothetical protein
MQITEEPDRRVLFEQIKGDMKLFRGYWQIESNTASDSSKLIYYSEMKPKIPLPQSVIKHIQEKDLPEVMQAVKQRSETISKKEETGNKLAEKSR